MESGLIARMLAAAPDADQTGQVSHETIYRALYVQGRGMLRQDLARKLSTGRTSRKPRGGVDRRGVRYEGAFMISDRMSQLPDHLRRSITWDRGVELAGYERIQLALHAPVYFCDPHSPWQRGLNGNTNRLPRFWFTKGSDLKTWDANRLRRVRE